MDGLNINMVNQYPAATAAGIIAAAQLNATNDAVTIAPGAAATDPIVITINGATTPASCSISYTAATTGPVAPVITPTTTNCS